ncbi:UbiA prenyltransferase family-domain-containing protein [Talaromyces proteolyticus]|uniref:UbiA prenyltransferase family-domain-containing protein n=1 Tax=Talaromyces proteolyticus TaxID=1131652 RepID=A0AAD4KS99_9EURO|nr:UbiA prenyltransferase family-domain-containing protein [Talaromyces proteolyticus]KAH8699214.1 UbiA prenyltransferase family-domain-containing protein [Talaromyces proteolyticus]
MWTTRTMPSHIQSYQIESQHLDSKGAPLLRSNRSLLFHAYTIYLFFYSDITTVMMPGMTFAILGSLTNSILTVDPLPISTVIHNSPRALIWLWAVLMVFDINNQNSPESIEEDRINKPSRPIASGRIHPTEASWLLQAMIVLSLIIGYVTGALQETVALFVLYWAYDNQGGNENWFMRNLLAAGGYIFYALGSLTIVSNQTDTRDARLWMLVFGLMILTTIHAQDFRDMDGDALKGRTTIPLIMGPKFSRWTLACSLIFWSVFCPFCLHLPLYAYFLTLGLGGFTGLRFVTKTDNASDKSSFHLYCIWVSIMLQLPAMKLL